MAGGRSPHAVCQNMWWLMNGLKSKECVATLPIIPGKGEMSLTHVVQGLMSLSLFITLAHITHKHTLSSGNEEMFQISKSLFRGYLKAHPKSKGRHSFVYLC